MNPDGSPTVLMSSDDVTVAVDDDGVAVVEITRPPNNFFDVVAGPSDIADALDELAAGD